MEKPRGDEPSRRYLAAYWVFKLANGLSRRKITSSGEDNLAQDEAYMLAYTHHNDLDVAAIGYRIYERTGRAAYFIAKEDMLKRFAIGSILKSLNAIPISRNGRPDLSQIRQPIEILRSGNILAIAPEGGRVDGDKVAPIKPGVGMIAAKANVEIVPVGIAGINPRIGAHHLYVPRSMHVHFGEPIRAPAALKDREEIDQRLQIALQDALDESYHQYDVIHGPEAVAKLDSGLAKHF